MGRGDEKDDEGQNGGEDGAHDLQPLDIAAVLDALGQQALLVRKAGAHEQAHRVHGRLAPVHERHQARRHGRDGGTDGNGAVEKMHAAFDEGAQAAGPLLLLGIVARQGLETVEVAGGAQLGGTERLEIAGLAGQEIAALARLGVGGVAQHGAQRIDHLIGVDDPALLLPLVLGEGNGEIHHGRKDQEQRHSRQQNPPIGGHTIPRSHYAG